MEGLVVLADTMTVKSTWQYACSRCSHSRGGARAWPIGFFAEAAVERGRPRMRRPVTSGRMAASDAAADLCRAHLASVVALRQLRHLQRRWPASLVNVRDQPISSLR